MAYQLVEEVLDHVTVEHGPADPRSLVAVGRFQWERALRRADDLKPPVKLFAVWLATYANADGSSVHPGEETLANHTGLTVQTVRRYMRALRDTGRIERVDQGGRRSGRADSYQLTAPSPVTGSPVTGSLVTGSPVTGSGITGDEITPSPVTKPPPTKEVPELDHHQVEVWRVHDRIAGDVAEFLGDPAWTRDRAAAALQAIAAGPKPPDSVEALVRGKIKKGEVAWLRGRLEDAERGSPPSRATPAPTCGECDAPKWPDPNPDAPRRPAPGPAERQVFDADGRTSVPCPRCHPHPKRGRRAA